MMASWRLMEVVSHINIVAAGVMADSMVLWRGAAWQLEAKYMGHTS